MQDSPSLRPRLDEMIAARYPAVRRMAMRETGLPTFPESCPYASDDLLNQEFWPD